VDASKKVLIEALALVNDGERILVIGTDPYEATGVMFLDRDVLITGPKSNGRARSRLGLHPTVACYLQFFVSGRASLAELFMVCSCPTITAGMGLVFAHNATGRLARCRIQGLVITAGGSTPTIEGCELIGGPGSGISCEDDSGPHVQHCKVSNYEFGLAAVENSKPRFEFNTVQQCRSSGIMIQDGASVHVNHNLTLRNGQHGIAVLGRAKAWVERNETCYNGLRSNEYEKWAAIYVQHEVGSEADCEGWNLSSV
jgi:hypothetical protein